LVIVLSFLLFHFKYTPRTLEKSSHDDVIFRGDFNPASLEQAKFLGSSRFQPVAEQIGKKAVIAVPDPFLVKRKQEQIRLFQPVEHVLAVILTG
jgi:hypothetical protein